MAEKKKIQLRVRDAKEVLFEGKVDRLSSFNEVGAFDIYPQHANFISLIKKELGLYNNNKMIKKIDFELAVLKIKKDVAKIFLGLEVIILDEKQ